MKNCLSPLRRFLHAFSPIRHCERPEEALQEGPFCTKLKFRQKEALQSGKAGFSFIGHCEGAFRRLRQSRKFAFSLVEMLMALLVVSILLAALAPVMTRKMNENIVISGTGGVVKNPEGYQCYPYKDSLNTVDMSLKDVYYANFIIASGGGGGAGATSQKVLDNQTLSAQSTNTANVSKTLTITEDMDEFKIGFMTAGGGGGGGGAVKYINTTFTPSAENCKNYGTGKVDTVGNTGENFATYINNICVTKFNQSVSGCNGDYIAKNNACIASKNTAYDYHGCNRIVCTYKQAQDACNALKTSTGSNWRLPTRDELSLFISNKYAISLCDGHNSANYTYCNYDATQTYKPYWVHGNNSNLRLDCVAGNQLSSSAMSAGTYVSTRCVLGSGGVKSFTSISGGGGGASPSVTSNNVINDELNTFIKNNAGGTIELTAGGGGTGGNAASTTGKKASNGTAGNNSIIRIKNKEGAVVFKITVPGGNFGYAADGTTTNGTGGNKGGAKALNTCFKQYSETGTAAAFNCTNTGKEGTNGAIKLSGIAAGGTGGTSSYTGSSTSGAGYNSSNGAGSTLSSGSNPGAGGGAGRSIETTSNTNGYIIGKGGNGSGGFIKLTYKRKFAAAPGGGGGGGSVAKITNLYVGKESNCTLVIGKGGNGGNVDNNGTDGGSSSIKCDSDSRTFIVEGGKGGKKGTAAQNQTSNPTPGTKGALGDADTYIYAIDPGKREIKKGLDGKDGSYNQLTKQGIGGRGGTSGTGTKGACGGLYEEENICKVDATASDRHIGKGFTYENIITPSSSDVQNSIYGTSSAGGGGGGWERLIGPGKGGNGLPGYVCVYWFNNNE